ncbi:MAG: ShlB/FhaC/HecB family hemolysin secretion/activation protein [Pseudomonadota bacterium]
MNGFWQVHPSDAVSLLLAKKITLLFCLIAVPCLASAQALPQSISPGQIEKRFEPQPLPQSRGGRFELREDEALPSEQAGAIRFELKQLLIEGRSAIALDALKPLYADLLGREVSLMDIYRVRDAITAYYRNAGYLLVRALIPAQDISSGTVRLLIIEGALNQVRISGTDSGGRIAAYAKKLQDSKPLRADDFERYVLLMDDLPGVKVRAVLSPSAGDALGSDLDLVVEPDRVAAGLSLGNRGTREIGPVQLYGSVDLSNLQQRQERTSLGVAVAAPIEELRYVSVRHTELLGAEGTSLSLGYSDSLAHPGGNLKPLDIASQGQSLSIELSHPLWRARSKTLRLNASLKGSNNTVEALDTELSNDQVRIAGLGADLDFADRLGGRNLISLQLARGLKGLGASSAKASNLSRLGGQPDFFRSNLSLLRQQPFADAWTLTLGLDGQWSPDVLLSSEQYAVGGEAYGHAFDPSAIAGDRGYGARLELAYRVRAELPRLKQLELFATTDGGGVYSQGVAAPGEWESIHSAGAGLRFQVGPYLFGTLEADKAMDVDSGSRYDRSWRFFYNLRAAL